MKCCLLLFYSTTNHFLIGLWHMTKVDFLWQQAQPAQAGRLRRCSWPKPNTHRKGMVTVWRAATGLIHYSFPNPGEIITSEESTQQIDAIHSKLQCLQLTVVNRKRPILLHILLHTAQPMFQKLNKLGYKVLLHLTHSLDPLTTTSSSILTTFCRENPSNNQQDVESCLSIVCWIPKHRFLSYRSKQPYFSLTKMCWV